MGGAHRSRTAKRASSTRASSRSSVRQSTRQSTRQAAPTAAPGEPSISAMPGGRFDPPMVDAQPQFTTTRVGTMRQADRAKRLHASSRRYLVRFLVVIGVIVVLLAGWAALYNSPVFAIQNVTVKGVEHLTSEEMAQLANVPTDTTLLRVDTETIANRVRQSSWVDDVRINRVFPDTLEIDVTERTVKAVVEIPISSGSAVKQWAIAEDHVWLMPIPEAGSEGAKTTSEKIYEDAENALHIVDVPYGTKAEIGETCADGNINNALDIVAGLTTDLADHVVEVSAAGTAETTLLLDSGVEVAFGKAEDIRDKERVILKILEENPGTVTYINVRMVETPTWRSI